MKLEVALKACDALAEEAVGISMDEGLSGDEAEAIASVGTAAADASDALLPLVDAVSGMGTR